MTDARVVLKGEAEREALARRAAAVRHAVAASGVPAHVIAELDDVVAEVALANDRLVAAWEEQKSLAEAAGERYRALFEDLPDAHLVTDGLGMILEANREAGELFGRSPDYLMSKPLAAFVHPEQRQSFRRVLLRLAQGLALDDWELRLVDHRDRVVLVTARSSVEAGDRVRLRWLIRDVIEQRRREQELRLPNEGLEVGIDARTHEIEHLSAGFAAVLRELPQGVVIIGLGGEVQLANRRAQELVDGADAFATEAVARALRGEETRAARAELVRDSETRLLEYSSTPVRDPTGEIVAAVLTFEDVTEREIRERAQREFVTNAAHELQTPLAAIASAVQVLKAGAKDDSKTRDRFLDHIDHAVVRLDRLTRALLVLARAQTREEPPRHELIELRPLLEDVAAALHPSRVRITITCRRDIAVIANRPLLEQALVNLGGNALKHSHGRVILAGRRSDGRVLIEVTDSGPGIPPSERTRIFDRFYRGGEPDGGGFGLGLAIVRDAVSALKGELELESSPNGTRVSISLPGARVRRA